MEDLIHTITVSDNTILEECGDEFRLIDSLIDADYCDTTGDGVDNLNLIFNVSSFDWHPDYLVQFDYLDSISIYCNKAQSLLMYNVQFMESLPPTEHLAINNIDLEYIPMGLLSPELFSLYIDNCNIKSLNMLFNVSLAELTISSSQLEEISSIENLSELQYLNLGYNNIRDISSLARGSYKTIVLENNMITDINALGSCLELEELHINGNSIKHYDRLVNCPKLRYLYASYTMQYSGLEELLPNVEIEYD